MGSTTRRPIRLSQPSWPRILTVTTLVVDVLAVIIAYILARQFVRDSLLPLRWPVAATAAIWPIAFAIFGLYQPRRLGHLHLAEVLRVAIASVMAALLCLLVFSLALIDVERDFIPVLLGFCVANVLIGRIVTRLLALTVKDGRTP
jgi:FlaA1/EpsC-like NDP-sugar epimerase